MIGIRRKLQKKAEKKKAAVQYPFKELRARAGGAELGCHLSRGHPCRDDGEQLPASHAGAAPLRDRGTRSRVAFPPKERQDTSRVRPPLLARGMFSTWTFPALV